MTSEARPREDDVLHDPGPSAPPGEDAAAPPGPVGRQHVDAEPPHAEPPDAGSADRSRQREKREAGQDGDGPTPGGRVSVPLVPALLVVLLLLLGATAFLWFTRLDASPVRTDDYVDALQAARSGVVDLTSFDHLTLDDDIEQIRRVATGELREEAVAELDANRQQLADAEAVVNTEIVGGGVTRATGSAATVWLVIQSTQESNTSPQAQVVRYRIEVELEKPDDRWLLAGIKGTGTENE